MRGDLPRRFGWVGALLLVAAACGGGSGPVGPPGITDLDADGLDDAAEAAILEQYRPWWDFDASETLFPISVDAWAARGGRVVSHDGSASADYDDVASLLAGVRAYPDGDLETRGEPIATDPGATLYVEAVPVSFTLGGRGNLVWLHYWLLYHMDHKDTELGPFSHHGDWEHICVLASMDDLGDPAAPPLGVHFHHHGILEVVESPTYEGCGGTAACTGTRHPHVWVDASGHGSNATPGEDFFGPHRGGSPRSGMLASPPLFLLPHPDNQSTQVDEIVREFRGRWGLQDASVNQPGPVGPLVANDPCDHDWSLRPTADDWLPSCRRPAGAAVQSPRDLLH